YLLNISVDTLMISVIYVIFFSSRRRHTRSKRDWSSDVCSSDLPGFRTEGFVARQKKLGRLAYDRLVDRIIELNAAIADDPALGHGFAIGHSYLSIPSDAQSDGDAASAWLQSVVEDELVPLLDEYWFDEPNKANGWAVALRTAIA